MLRIFRDISFLAGQRLKIFLLLTLLSLTTGMVQKTTQSTLDNCQIFQPANQLTPMTFCIQPLSGETILTGVERISVSVAESWPDVRIRRVIYYLDDTYLQTEFEPPFTFLLPTHRFLDGEHRLAVEILTDDGVTSPRATIGLTFRNGVTELPAKRTSFDPRAGLPENPTLPFVVTAVGDGASDRAAVQSVIDLIASWQPGLFLYLGDVYEKGTPVEFYNWFGQDQELYGRLRAITRPVIGNHEYGSGWDARGYFEYWDNIPSYYSFDVAGWHFIALNSNCARVGGCHPNSPQMRWLDADLSAHPNACTVAYLHHPRFSIGQHGNEEELQPIWKMLYDAGVDIVLAGHDHNYQRWRPLNENGRPVPDGMTQFVVGTGGHGIRRFGGTSQRVAVGIDERNLGYGALRLDLYPDKADFRFVNLEGQVLDAGTLACRTPPNNTSGISEASAPSPPSATDRAALHENSISIGTPASHTRSPATLGPTSQRPQSENPQPSFPIRAIFYYPRFPEAWQQQGLTRFTQYQPTAGLYDSADQATIQQHIAAMQYGRIDAGIASWSGPGTRSDSRFPLLLEAAAGTSFRWAVYYEQEGRRADPSPEQIRADLTYLAEKYGHHPSYLRIDGRFVVFVYTDGTDDCTMAGRWETANTVDAYLVLKVFPGFRKCPHQPAGWHQYAPAHATTAHLPFSYTISPGFWKANEEHPRLPRNLVRWQRNIRSMIESGARFQLITTFNEWGEGTSIEPAPNWASNTPFGAYLDALHSNGRAPSPPAADLDSMPPPGYHLTR